ncbi:MAG: glycosyltransferase, partial [Methanothrix sp.]|nr:glycosyltransferase [Methanothrix sp.]
MAEEEPVVSIVIPVATAGAFTRKCLQSVLDSLADFDGSSQIILVLNGLGQGDRESLATLLAHPKVRSVERPERLGSAPARCLGIGLARGRYVLSTDADCLVPVDWVAEMVKAGAGYGVASGQVQAANRVLNTYVRVQQEIDRVRNSAVNRSGTRRYLTAANMAARRELLNYLV